MKIPPTYEITPDVLELIVKIESNRIFLSSLDLNSIIKEKIQRISLLKSSLFSARIEGNPLTMDNVHIAGKSLKKTEVFNISEAIRYINRQIKPEQLITLELIKQIHKIIMKDIFDAPGAFRKEMGAIFNQAGAAVYLSPPPQEIFQLLDKLLDYVNYNEEKFPLLTAFVAHLVFEKIHPFIDGNGRVGRLLVLSIFKSKGYDFNLDIPFEEFVDEHKADYYYYLDIGLTQTTQYLLFMLKAFYEETEKIKAQVLSEMQKGYDMLLPPRQEEIYLTIKDHHVVSFDFIRRRFMAVPERTLRYDLKKLQEKNLIVKVGRTNGSFYRLKQDI